jgi:predicted enzyme related to lactoylglutathione lyase
VEHFEIPVDDIARASKFYSEVFGFEYEPWGDEMGMLRPAGGEGIGGDLHKRGEVPHPTVVITVDNLEDTLAAVIAGGGEQLGEIQSMGESARYVYFKDTEGNIVGAYDDAS